MTLNNHLSQLKVIHGIEQQPMPDILLTFCIYMLCDNL